MTKKSEQELAREMRLAGRTYDDIAADLGISKSTCSACLRGLPHPPEGTEPALLGAPTDPVVAERLEVAAARRMRAEGKLLKEIAECFEVTVKTASVWCSGMAWPRRARQGGSAEHMDMMRRKYWDRTLAERDVERQALKAASAARVGALCARELELVAVTAYWCEGCKDKSYARREKIALINSDPGLILLWEAYLDQLEIAPERRRYSLSIHETADVPAAQQWWAELLDVPSTSFMKATIKRHNPKTVRKNTGDAYRGCLVTRVLQGADLYRHIAGTWEGMMAGLSPRG
jgi:DNA-binding CsgD family transcriptional regulator